MARPSNYSPELRARAVRMVAELTPDYPSQYAAICAVAKKLGIGTAETLRKWVRRAEVDAGERRGRRRRSTRRSSGSSGRTPSCAGRTRS
jgi:transposase